MLSSQHATSSVHLSLRVRGTREELGFRGERRSPNTRDHARGSPGYQALWAALHGWGPFTEDLRTGRYCPWMCVPDACPRMTTSGDDALARSPVRPASGGNPCDRQPVPGKLRLLEADLLTSEKIRDRIQEGFLHLSRRKTSA